MSTRGVIILAVSFLLVVTAAIADMTVTPGVPYILRGGKIGTETGFVQDIFIVDPVTGERVRVIGGLLQTSGSGGGSGDVTDRPGRQLGIVYGSLTQPIK